MAFWPGEGGGEDLNKNFPKIQMPRGGGGSRSFNLTGT